MGTFLKSTKGKIIVACIAVVLIAIVLVIVFLPKNEYRTIVISEIDGTALVSNDKKQGVSAYSGMPLYDGDRITVNEDSRLTIELDGEKYMIAEGGTVFTLEATGKPGSDKTVIHLESGAALTRIKNKLNESQGYVIKTPTSTISVRGTVYYVQFTTDEDGKAVTYCNTFDGEVEVTPTDSNGVPTEEPQSVPAGSSVGVREVSADENGEIQDSEFIRDETGNAQQPIDYSNIPVEIIEELIVYIDDGENLHPPKDELEDYLDSAHTHTFGDWIASNDGANHERSCECGETEKLAHSGGTATCIDDVWYECCTECGAQLEHTHTVTWSSDEYEHYSYCSDCNATISELEEHIYDAGTINGEVQIFVCTVCGYEKEMFGYYALDGLGYGEYAFEGDGIEYALSDPESSRIVYILCDNRDRGFGGFNLPYLMENDSSLLSDVYTMTLDLNQHAIRLGTTPQLGTDTIWTIIAPNGGVMLTDGGGLGYSTESPPAGTIIIKGGLYDFDPTTYLADGYAAKMVSAPIFETDYNELLETYGTYEDIIYAGNYPYEAVGFWFVYQEGTDLSACAHDGYIYTHINMGAWDGEYCGKCGEKLPHECVVEWYDLAEGHEGYCKVCGKPMFELTDHTFDNGVSGTNTYGEATTRYTCKVCGYEMLETVHTGGTATCTARAECETCGESYGKYAAHDPGRGAYSADNTYHWNTCMVCTAKVDKTAHTGGTATYFSKAMCGVCGCEYGSFKDITTSDKLPVPDDILFTMTMDGIQDSVPNQESVAKSIGFKPYAYVAPKVFIDVYLDDALNSSKYGLSYKQHNNTVNYLFVRSLMYNNTNGEYPVSFKVLEGFNVLLIDSDYQLTLLTDLTNAVIGKDITHIAVVRDLVLDDLLSVGATAFLNNFDSYRDRDKYGAFVFELVFDDTEFILELGGTTRRIARHATTGGALEITFNYDYGRYIESEIGLSVAPQYGASSTQGFGGFNLGSITTTQSVTANCTGSHAEHTAITKNAPLNNYLNEDGSSTVVISESAVELPDGIGTNGSYTHFAQAYYSNRVFFYFTINNRTYSYYADLLTSEPTGLEDCYNKTAADFGWTEYAPTWAEKYFGSNSDATELYTPS